MSSSSEDLRRFVVILCAAYFIQACSSFLWYSPISKTQTLEDCLLMKESRSPFYPSYCDRLLQKYQFGAYGTTTVQPLEARSIGWGWSTWGEWVEDSCPEICGRRCRKRQRACAGPYHVSCQPKGRAFEFEDCPALEGDDSILAGGGGDGDDGDSAAFTRDFMRTQQQQQQQQQRQQQSQNLVWRKRLRRKRKP